MRYTLLSLFLLTACGPGNGTRVSDADADAGPDGDATVDTGPDVRPDVSTDTGIDDAIEDADYYVATDGDDDNPGTIDEPFATIQHAHDVAVAGDLIYVRGGTYEVDHQTRFRNEGTASEPITVRAYPGEQVLIDASAVDPGDMDGASTPTWTFDDAKHWQIIGPIHLTNGRVLMKPLLGIGRHRIFPCPRRVPRI